MTMRWLAVAGAAVCLGSAFAEQPKVIEQNGHLSPLMAKVTFLNGSSRNVMIMGTGNRTSGNFYSHQFFVRTEGGASKLSLWLDTIAAIKGTGSLRTLNSEFTVVLKDGKDIPASFVGGWGLTKCAAGSEPDSPDSACTLVTVTGQDESGEVLDLRNLKSVEFLSPTLTDKAGNAMFDNWRFSPFTGERIAPVSK